MKDFCFMNVALNVQYERQNIEYILLQGQSLGLIYLEDDMFSLNPPMSIEKAASRSLYEECEQKDKYSIITKFNDGYFRIYFSRAHNYALNFSLKTYGPYWEKGFSDGEYASLIDLSRYVHTVFELCNNINIVKFDMCSDDRNNIIPESEHCVVAVIRLGLFNRLDCFDIEVVQQSIASIFYNARTSGNVFFDKDINRYYRFSPKIFYDILKAGFPMYLYVQKNNISFKVEIKRGDQGYDFVFLYPLAPYQMKKGYGSEDEKIDVAFYMQRLVELCENFAIYELKTFI